MQGNAKAPLKGDAEMALDKMEILGSVSDTGELNQEGMDHGVAQAIGAQVRGARNKFGLTVARVGQLTGLSPGMLSKIENGNALPSLTTLHALSRAFKVPMTYFFETHEETQGCCYVKKDGGLFIESRGSRAGHQYQLLGHGVGKEVAVAPYMIELTDTSEVFPLFQHPGVEFIHMLEGEVVYRHGGRQYHLSPGDSLFFEGSTAHGPAKLLKLPIRFLSIMIEPGRESSGHR